MKVEFSVHELNRDLFEQRLERLRSACEVNSTLFKLDSLGSKIMEVEKVQINEVTNRKSVYIEEVEFDYYQLEFEEPEEVKYVYVGLLRKVGEQNLLDIDSNFKTNYLMDTEHYDIGIPDEIYSIELECEHCHSGRELKKSHVVFDLDEDLFFQVASGCLTPYTYFNKDVDTVRNFEWLSVEYERTTLDGVNRVGYDYSILDDLLLHTLTYYLEQDKLTYIPRSEASFDRKRKCSIDLVKRHMGTKAVISKEAVEKLEDLKYFLSTDSRVEQPNTSIMIEENLVPKSKEGYLIYQAFRFLKSLENDVYVTENKGKVEKKKDSNYVGVVGEKIELEATYVRLVEFETAYGTVGMHFFETDDGDILVWRTAKWLHVDKGDRFNLKGKVKSHDTFRDVKQTHINYVKMFKLETEEVKKEIGNLDTETKKETEDISNLDKDVLNFLKFQ